MKYSDIPKYEALPEQEYNEDVIAASSARKPMSRKYLSFLAVVTFVAGALCSEGIRKFYHHAEPKNLTLATLPLTEVHTTFQYNRTFAEAPGHDSGAAWRGIFPTEGAFFSSPDIAPSRSTFAVFHQLHCVDVLRQSYYIYKDAANNGTLFADDEIRNELRPSHVRHCFDFLRQNIMCHADTTVEVEDQTVKGVHGFGTPRVCRDWSQLINWVEDVQTKWPVTQKSKTPVWPL